MTRKEIIHLLILQARANGFEFRKWYQTRIDPEWTSMEAAMEILSKGSRYYALLFSHQFARHFWKPGGKIQFLVPTREYTKRNRQGEQVKVVRKAYTRLTMRGSSWEYHLTRMVAEEEPLRYIRRFLVTEEEIEAQRSGANLDPLTDDDEASSSDQV